MQESPFDETPLIAMYLEPILNTYDKTYQTIVTLNAMPKGPLSDLVARQRTPKLSEFQTLSPHSTFSDTCVYVLMRYPQSNGVSAKRGNVYMYAEDIPSIYGYLEKNGYRIRSDLAKQFGHVSGVGTRQLGGTRKLICMFQ